MINRLTQEQKEIPELLPVCYTLLEALRINDLLEKEGVELYCKGMGYAISWRKVDD